MTSSMTLNALPPPAPPRHLQSPPQRAPTTVPTTAPHLAGVQSLRSCISPVANTTASCRWQVCTQLYRFWTSSWLSSSSSSAEASFVVGPSTLFFLPVGKWFLHHGSFFLLGLHCIPSPPRRFGPALYSRLGCNVYLMMWSLFAASEEGQQPLGWHSCNPIAWPTPVVSSHWFILSIPLPGRVSITSTLFRPPCITERLGPDGGGRRGLNLHNWLRIIECPCPDGSRCGLNYYPYMTQQCMHRMSLEISNRCHVSSPPSETTDQ
jgi:hypothetical protein